jgi:hypothetical protein
VIHLVHGIHDMGATPIENLLPFLVPYAVAYPDYGWIASVETRIVNPIIVGTLKPYIGPDDVLICHSNGCAIGYDLMNRGLKMGGAIFINGALKQNILRPAGVPWIDVYFNAGDDITEAAKIGAALGITDLVWGEMGHAGYVGTDPNIANIDCGNTAGMPVVSGHSDFFTKLSQWGPFLANRLRIHLGANVQAVA